MTDETIIPITALELDPRNARKRTPRSSKVIGESLQEFGPLRSLVGQRLPDGRIVVRAGNGTLEEAGQIGIDKVRIVERRPDELVVVVADDLDETQWTRYAIADNRASDLSTWDAEVLEILDQEIDLEPFFLGDELNALMAGLAGDSEGLVESLEPMEGLTDDNAIPEEVETRVKRGDIWQLGRHRVMCGDSTVNTDVERLMDGQKADMVFTSPPYNLGTTSGGGFPSSGGMWTNSGIEDGYESFDDSMPMDEYKEWQSEILSILWHDVLSDNGAIFYNYRPRVQNKQLMTPFDWNPGLTVRQVIIWYSGAGINFSPTHYRPSCEWVVLFAKNGFELLDKSSSGCGDVWQIPACTEGRKLGHPAPFPVAFAEQAIVTTKAQKIMEPFLGSGTTLIACEKTGRTCYGMELSEKYCDVILKRWEDFTGKEAVLLK